jgi:hypothetical protein
MGILGSITAPKRLHQANHLAPLLEAGFDERQIDQVRKQRVRGNEQVRARNQDPHGADGKLREEGPESGAVGFVENREPRQRLPLAPVERWRNAPHPAPPGPKLILFSRAVFLQSVGRVCNYRVNGTRLSRIHPFESISQKNSIRAG